MKKNQYTRVALKEAAAVMRGVVVRGFWHVGGGGVVCGEAHKTGLGAQVFQYIRYGKVSHQ